MLNSVIVVDDEASIRSAVEQWLSLSGFAVQLFSCAEDCLRQLPPHFAGVVVSDVRMPGMGGLALLSQLQQLDADLPVILLTARGHVLEPAQLATTGIRKVMAKPFSARELVNVIGQVLAEASGEPARVGQGQTGQGLNNAA